MYNIYTEDDVNDGKQRTILYWAANPSYTPFDIPDMQSTNQPCTYTTDTGQNFPITHNGRLDFPTTKGYLSTHTVVIPHICDTLLYIREIAKSGQSLIFSHNHAYT